MVFVIYLIFKDNSSCADLFSFSRTGELVRLMLIFSQSMTGRETGLTRSLANVFDTLVNIKCLEECYSWDSSFSTVLVFVDLYLL